MTLPYIQNIKPKSGICKVKVVWR